MIAIGDALKDEATRKIVSSHPFRLDDWQVADLSFDVAEGKPDHCHVSVDASKRDAIWITALDQGGAKICEIGLELQDGVFRVLAYDSDHEEPVIVKITESDVVVDTSERR